MKKQLIYAATIGGCIGALVTVALSLVVPLEAKNEVRDASFGEITCRRLLVRGEDEMLQVMIESDDDGGNVRVRGKDGKSGAALGIDEDGGTVIVHDKESGAKALTSKGLR